VGGNSSWVEHTRSRPPGRAREVPAGPGACFGGRPGAAR
jgi:hypothetical protein